MTGRALRSEFETFSVSAGDAMVYDEQTALSLIRRAEEEYVAVVGVEPMRADALSAYAAPGHRSLTDEERLRSWYSAREFVESLCGRDLYFDVVLESPMATYLAKLRYLFRNGAEWSPHQRGGTIQ